MVSTCRQFGFRRRRLLWMAFSPDVSSCPLGGDLLGLICLELGVTPLVNPGTRPGGPAADSCQFPGGSHRRGHASVPDVGRRRGSGAGSLGDGGLAGNGDAHCRPCCGVSPVTGDIFCASGSLDVGRGLASAGGGCSCWYGGRESSSELDSVAPGFPACLVASPGLPPSSSASRSAPDIGPPSSLAAAEQKFPWSTTLPLELSAESNMLPWGGGGGGCSWVDGVLPGRGYQRLPDLSLEGPFDVHQEWPVSGASPRVLDGMRGCQYRMTSYDQDSEGPDFSPAHGVQLHDPWLLEYVGALESARLLSRSPEYWWTTWIMRKRLGLQLQHDAGLLLSNVQVLQQLVTSFNRTSSEVMRVAFGRAPFPADAMQQVVPSYLVRSVAHYMAAMGLWRPPSSQGVRGPLPSATCNACMSCSDCFPDLPVYEQYVCFHVC